MITEQQIKGAACRLCEMRGVDPESIAGYSPVPGYGADVMATLVPVRAVESAADEIRAEIARQQVRDAIIHVMVRDFDLAFAVMSGYPGLVYIPEGEL